ncbi:MAG: winged helix-turn-helix transcriptional regulator [DPANN group archaeon]|nr:winged helix-turn-helix transcriptional regulator [DPANN group archaeon]
MNELSSLMSEKNLEILNIIKTEDLSIREISEKIGCSPGKITQATKIFEKYGIVNVTKRKNRIILKPNYNSQFYCKIMSLSNTHRIVRSRTYARLAKIGTVGIYGSYAKGTDDANSDIDLMIWTDKKDIEVRGMIRALSKEIGLPVNSLLLNKKKVAQLKTRDDEFYSRLAKELIVLNDGTFDKIG